MQLNGNQGDCTSGFHVHHYFRVNNSNWLSSFFFPFSNKTDEAISLDDLQKLKLAFEVLITERYHSDGSILDDVTVFLFSISFPFFL